MHTNRNEQSLTSYLVKGTLILAALIVTVMTRQHMQHKCATDQDFSLQVAACNHLHALP